MTVDYQLADGVATLTMDDGKVNVMSPAMQAALHAALDKAQSDGAVVLIAGRPGVFSAGFDLNILRGDPAAAFAMSDGGFELARRLLAFPAPVVMACTGHAIAMGTFLLFSGDYRVGAAGEYKLMANEVMIGIPVPRAATEILRHRLTPSAFLRAAMLSEQFTPANAVEVGWLDLVVAPEEVVPTATGIAQMFTGLDRASHIETKRRARQSTLDAIVAGMAADAAGRT
jgi:enoyl-CoA hydratase